MAIPTQTRAWIIQNNPETVINLSSSAEATFALASFDIPSSVPDDSLLVKTIWLSNDPAQRAWIQKGADPKRLYVPPVKEGEIMACGAIAQVIRVGGLADTHKEGDLVLCGTGWAEYSVVKKKASQLLTSIPGVPSTAFLGALGATGLTAYWGLVDVLKFEAGETIIVSGAAGAVGNVVVQLAKHVFGAKRVIAIVGSDAKAEYIRSLGADVALNYKSPQFGKELIEATPEYSETFFDNVGGPILDLVLTRLKRYGRIAACGAISVYNDISKTNLTNYTEIILGRLELKGFIILDYLHRPEGIQALLSAIKEKKLVLTGGETIVEVSGLEEVPQVWYGLFEGKNQAKLVTKLP